MEKEISSSLAPQVISPVEVSQAEKASALMGLKSLTEYITRIMNERSSEILSEYEQISLSDDLFDRFSRACDRAAEPNEALRAAADYTKQRGF